MLLWSVKGRDEVRVDLAGDVSLQASDVAPTMLTAVYSVCASGSYASAGKARCSTGAPHLFHGALPQSVRLCDEPLNQEVPMYWQEERFYALERGGHAMLDADAGG
jgi:hypothetical protein